eukprot:366064-Chlamydomonas_euryale.AAC.14
MTVGPPTTSHTSPRLPPPQTPTLCTAAGVWRQLAHWGRHTKAGPADGRVCEGRRVTGPRAAARGSAMLGRAAESRQGHADCAADTLAGP